MAEPEAKRAPILRQFELIEAVKAYDPTADEAMLNRAYVYAMKMHGSQLRASGDPYFAHPIQVAGILTDYKLDTATIVTALLHDVVEDTTATKDDIAKLFGDEVAELVEGVTKLSRLEMQAERIRQAENLRKFILAISKDVRVLLVKLADRLHNMRTLKYVKPAKRERIARETLEVYAPLGRSIGIHSIALELEELSFEHLNPTARDAIQRRLEGLKLEHGGAVEGVSREIGLGPVDVKLSLFLKPTLKDEFGTDPTDPLFNRYDVVPDWMLTQHGHRLADGALGRILAIPGEPWTDLQRAAYHAGLFDEACTSNFRQQIKGQQRARRRSSFQGF